MSSNTKSDPTIFVIFGGTGDLNARKIAPALYNLFLDGWLPAQFSIIGTGRTKLTDDQFRDNLFKDINLFSRSVKAQARAIGPNFRRISSTRYQTSTILKPTRNLVNVLKSTMPNGKPRLTCFIT